jgi:hypothetical protein
MSPAMILFLIVAALLCLVVLPVLATRPPDPTP